MEKIQIRIQQIWICVLDISCLSCGALGKLANLFEPSFIHIVSENWGFPSGSVVKNHPANAGDAEDANLIPRSGRSPGEANGNPLQYACLGNPMNREYRLARFHGVAKSWRYWVTNAFTLCVYWIPDESEMQAGKKASGKLQHWKISCPCRHLEYEEEGICCSSWP